MRKNVYIDLHIVETVPPSCVNRDDTGRPKTAVYGGVTRARVSSQCWKKAIRERFEETLSGDQIGKRTLHVHRLLTDAIRVRNPELNAEELAQRALDTALVKLKEDKKKKDGILKTNALFFVSPSQIEALAELAVSGKKMDKKQYQAALKVYPSVDVALFGRMVADDPSLNFDAAAQVAHAISTHAVQNEYDYFTAVDDCSHAGAGHLGTVEYNSATLYRYATVNVTELEKNLGERTPEAVRAFAEAFIRSMPKGKITTFANNVLPDAVYVTVRHDQPINLVGAFETPVRAGQGGYVKPSVKALTRHAQAVYHAYLGEPDQAFAIGEGMDELVKEMTTLPQLLDAVENSVKEIGGQA